MIEELRPLKEHYNELIIPVLKLMSHIRNEALSPITQDRVLPFFKDVKQEITLDFLDRLYEENDEDNTGALFNLIVEEHDDFDESDKAYTLRLLDFNDLDNDYIFDLNVLENSKVFLRDLPKNSIPLYQIANVIMHHYPFKQIPYIVELLQFEGKIGKIVDNKGNEFIV